MRFAKALLMIALVAALAAYALDCGAAMTPEQAMQCCNSMPCSSQGHRGDDCCKTMTAMHAPFVQTSSANAKGVSFSPAVFGLISASAGFPGFDSSIRSVSAHSHAPPILSAGTSLPLRV